jgi:integrase
VPKPKLNAFEPSGLVWKDQTKSNSSGLELRGAFDWKQSVALHVKREKRGITPWVSILPEMGVLLKDMKKRATGDLLFPSPLDAAKPRDVSAVRRRITTACRRLEISHVTPHGLWSYFVTQARQSGLTDAEIAMLIGDKTGPAIIAQTYGDVRSDLYLLKRNEYG